MADVRLLEPNEPPAFEVVRPDGRSPFVLTCDHASPRLPVRLGTLGLPEADLRSHVGWDLGAAAVARRLSELWNAPLVLCAYSRLAIDANRPLDAASSIPTSSWGIGIPGNQQLGPEERLARAREIFHPYHDAIRTLLAERDERGASSIILALHSFTPVLQAVHRPWQIGVMYGRDRRLAARLITWLQHQGGVVVGDNEPYRVTDATDYGIPHHAERTGRLGAIVEIRQDEIADAAGRERFARLLARAGEAALRGRPARAS